MPAVVCPSCAAKINVPVEAIGKVHSCPGCHSRIQLVAAAMKVPIASTPSAQEPNPFDFQQSERGTPPTSAPVAIVQITHPALDMIALIFHFFIGAICASLLVFLIVGIVHLFGQ